MSLDGAGSWRLDGNMRHGPSRSGVPSWASSAPWTGPSPLGPALPLVLALLCACGAGTPEGEVPLPALGSTPEAGAKFAALARTWTFGSRDQRQKLDGDLSRFEQRYPEDGLVLRSLLYRAWNALERGDLALTRQLVRRPLNGPPGVTRDQATLLLGAAERRDGHPREAIAKLEPLLDKLIDPVATALLDEELVMAALGAGERQKALRYMALWLRETDRGGRAETAAKIEALLANLSATDLRAALEPAPGDPQEPLAEDMQRLLVDRLAALAEAASDDVLARALLDRWGQLLGERGEDIARLATDTARARVTPGTIGLVMALGSAELRHRSVEVAAGMAFGLGIPGSGARLVSRDGHATAADVASAVGELVADGAAVIVAGIDPALLAPTAALAQSEALPMILLTAPTDLVVEHNPYVFVLGEAPDRTAGLLLERLSAGGARRPAWFGAPEPDSAAPPGEAVAGDPEWPCSEGIELGKLRAARSDVLLLRDGARCAGSVAAAALTLRIELGVGLGVTGWEAERPASATRLAAGIFPVDDPPNEPRLRAWLAAGRRAPSWWAALGRDAAVLSWAAVRELGPRSTDDPNEVAARHKAAAKGLAKASEELWTTDERGFGASRTMVRAVTVHAAGGGSRVHR